MDILKGKLGNRRKEIALVIVFLAMTFIARQYKFPIVDGIDVKFAAAFNYLPATLVSFDLIWVNVLFAIFTESKDPFKKLFTTTTGQVTAFFMSRFLPTRGWWKVLPMIIATYATNTVGAIYRHAMGQVPFIIGFPATMVKATVSAAVIILIVPAIQRAISKMGLIDYDD